MKIIFGIVAIVLLVLIFAIPSIGHFFSSIFLTIGRLNTDLFGRMPAWFGIAIFAVFFSLVLEFIWSLKK